MNKAQLIKAVEDRLETGAKSAKDAVDQVVDIIIREVAKGEKVAISGFGVFEKKRRGARTARNPKTGAAVKVKARAVPSFRAGTPFKEVVSGAKKLDKVVKSTARSAAGAAGISGKKTVSRRPAASKSAAAKTLAKKSPPNKSATKARAAKTLAKKSPAKKAATKANATKSATARKAVAKKTTAKKATKKAAKKTVAKKSR
ncbi:MAG: HU family DNA-binding protein [Mycobacteriales bacterium]